jgi:chromosome segregation ATPase
MAYRANQQLREDIWDYRYPSAPAPLPDEEEKVVSFARQPVKGPSTTALSLMQQATEMFEGIENQARETEARAQSLCKSATERLRLAEKQRDASERARRDLINDFNARIEEMAKAMQRAEKRIVSAEDHAIAAEFRAQAAEAQLHKANRELAAIEDMIRKRLV